MKAFTAYAEFNEVVYDQKQIIQPFPQMHKTRSHNERKAHILYGPLKSKFAVLLYLVKAVYFKLAEIKRYIALFLPLHGGIDILYSLIGSALCTR